MTIIRVIDFETTGIPSEADKHAICEIGWCDVAVPADGHAEYSEVGKPTSTLINPGRAIPVEAMAVHHIQDRDVAGQPAATDIFPAMCRGADVFAAHKADFEQAFFDGLGRPWIDTWKVALRVMRDAPAHNNQVLRYFLGLDLDPALAHPPHRAAPDAYVTAHVLAKLLDLASVDDMVRWSAGPALLITCHMQKHRGTKWENVPADYLDWIVNKSGITDRDIRATAKYYLRAAIGEAPQ